MTDIARAAERTCPFCVGHLAPAAIVCPHCGADLARGRRRDAPSPGGAVALSIIPGLGHLYCGAVFAGIAWFVAVSIGYALFVIPGAILHVTCFYAVYQRAMSTGTVRRSEPPPAWASQPPRPQGYSNEQATNALLTAAIAVVAALIVLLLAAPDLARGLLLARTRGRQEVPPAAQPLATTTSNSTPSSARESAESFKILSVDSRVTETNDVWYRYSWKVELHNQTTDRHAFMGTVEFQDKDGFIIDTSPIAAFPVEGGSTDTATGAALVRLPGAARVARTVAKVQMR